MSDQGSGFEWRRKRRGINKGLERVEEVPWNVLSGRLGLFDRLGEAKALRGGEQGPG